MPIDGTTDTGCKAAAGVYYLPKKEIKVSVTQSATGFFALDLVDNGAVADRNYPFCLDFVGSPAADDQIVVERTAGLLTSVHSNASDQTLQIAEAVVDTGLVAVTGNPNAGLRAARLKIGDNLEVADLVFDPFDRRRVAQINESLGSFGYCLLVDGHTLRAFTDVQVQNYCNKPVAYTDRQFAHSVQEEGANVNILPSYGGIVYRANTTRAFVIMRRRDPGSSKPWLLHMTKIIEMPNESPIFSVGVDRSLFVMRDTKLTFDNGVLTDVTISKPSEALAAAGFTLRLAQTLIDIPAQIIRVRIQAVNNRKALIDAQNQLIYTQAQYSSTLSSLRSGALSSTADGSSPQRGVAMLDPGAGTRAGELPDRDRLIGENCSILPESQRSNCVRKANTCAQTSNMPLQLCLSDALRP